MNEDTQSKIFEPFFTTKEMGRGKGLGLAMVLGIVKQHNGWVECHSSPGAGTRFDLYLPAAVEPIPPGGSKIHFLSAEETATLAQAPGELTLAEGATAPRTVLVVDDEAMIRTLARVVLERAGFRVLLAQDGADAVDLFSRERDAVDLIVMDMTMPRMSGREAYRQISRIAPGIRILFSSGYSAEDASDLEGSLGLLTKPYRPGELLTAVREALGAMQATVSS
jgi:CheY-like chemotaxis protein